MRMLLPVLALLLVAAPAEAALTPAAIGEVGVALPPGARAPLDLAFRDDQGAAATLRTALGGKPGLLIFADYTCISLCGPALVLAKAGLESSGLRPGVDYRLAVIGLNPRDGAVAAQAMRRDRLGDDPAIDRASSFLVGDPRAIQAATSALGYHYVYDAEHDQYAHPAVAYALAPDGRVSAVVPEIGLTGPALARALAAARTAAPPPPTLLAQGLHILCYGFDPAKGLYNGATLLTLRLAALATLVFGAAALAWSVRRRREARS